MKAIYKGKCHFVVSRDTDAIWIEQLFRGIDRSDRMLVRLHDPDLILDPIDEDLDLAEAFERGEINAFEYADGHTFPPGLEIESVRRSRHVRRFSGH
jgi:hypothetical protein